VAKALKIVNRTTLRDDDLAYFVRAAFRALHIRKRRTKIVELRYSRNNELRAVAWMKERRIELVVPGGFIGRAKALVALGQALEHEIDHLEHNMEHYEMPFYGDWWRLPVLWTRGLVIRPKDGHSKSIARW
jgi:hypothetical protein